MLSTGMRNNHVVFYFPFLLLMMISYIF